MQSPSATINQLENLTEMMQIYKPEHALRAAKKAVPMLNTITGIADVKNKIRFFQD